MRLDLDIPSAALRDWLEWPRTWVWGASVTVSLVVLALVGGLIVYPRYVDVLELRERTAKLEHTHQLHLSQRSQRIALQKAVNEHTSVSQHIDDALPPQPKLHRVVASIYGAAERANVTLSAINWQPIEQQAQLKVQPILLDFSASYDQLVVMAQALENYPRIISVQSALIERSLETEGDLKVSMVVHAYHMPREVNHVAQ